MVLAESEYWRKVDQKRKRENLAFFKSLISKDPKKPWREIEGTDLIFTVLTRPLEKERDLPINKRCTYLVAIFSPGKQSKPLESYVISKEQIEANIETEAESLLGILFPITGCRTFKSSEHEYGLILDSLVHRIKTAQAQQANKTC